MMFQSIYLSINKTNIEWVHISINKLKEEEDDNL